LVAVIEAFNQKYKSLSKVIKKALSVLSPFPLPSLI